MTVINRVPRKTANGRHTDSQIVEVSSSSIRKYGYRPPGVRTFDQSMAGQGSTRWQINPCHPERTSGCRFFVAVPGSCVELDLDSNDGSPAEVPYVCVDCIVSLFPNWIRTLVRR